MHPDTLAALRTSIAKYERLLNVTEPPGILEINASSCALCCRFMSFHGGPNSVQCTRHDEKCPVFKASGSPGCDDTPWYNVYYAMRDWSLETHIYGTDLTATKRAAFHEAVAEELDFLRSLLPQDQEENVP